MSTQAMPSAAPAATVPTNPTVEAPSESLDAAASDETSSDEGSEEDSEDITPPKPVEEMTKKELKEYKLKLNGKEKVVKFDPYNDEEVVRYLQKAEAADAKFREAAELRKSAEQFIEILRKDPRRVLSDPNIGIDVKEFAKQIINEEIEDMQKTPEQKEKEKLQREIEELKEKQKLEAEERQTKEFMRLQEEAEHKLDNDITQALEMGGLPKTARTVKTMAEMMMLALQNDIDLSPQDLVPLVKKQTLSEFKEMLSSSNDDVLEEFLKDHLPRLRKRQASKAKEAIKTANSVKPTGNATTSKPTEAEKKQTLTQWLRS